MVTNQEIKKEFDMFQELWRIFKTYHDAGDTDATWEKIAEEFRQLNKKVGTVYCQELCVSTMCELERVIRGNSLEDSEVKR